MNLLNDCGESPLHCAVENGHEDIVLGLLDASLVRAFAFAFVCSCLFVCLLVACFYYCFVFTPTTNLVQWHKCGSCCYRAFPSSSIFAVFLLDACLRACQNACCRSLISRSLLTSWLSSPKSFAYVCMRACVTWDRLRGVLAYRILSGTTISTSSSLLMP